MLESESIRNEFLSGLATRMVSETLFAHINSIVFCVKDRSGRYISCNQSLANRIGLSGSAEIVGKTIDDLFPPDLAKTYKEQDAYVFASGNPIQNRLELVVNKTGKALGWHLTSKIPLFDYDDAVHGIVTISEDLDRPRDEDINMAGLAKVSEYVRANFHENLRTANLAEIAGISPTQLDRKMRRVYKISVAQFIRQVRLQAAADLLLGSSISIAAIAADCGYADQSALTRQFKASSGLTPGAYRSQYQKP